MGYKRPTTFMKKLSFFLLVLLAISATSCKMIGVSATTQHPATYINTATVADLEVSNERISFTFQASAAVRRGGTQNVIKTAVREALRVNGGGDLLVDMEYITVSGSPFFSYIFGISPIKEVTVSGYPAKYTNFHNLDDSIWAPTQLYPDNIPANKTSLKSINKIQ
jgi:hypothetical protein